MNQKLILALAMLLVATVAFAQNPTGQGPTALNGGLPQTAAGQQVSGSGPNNQGGVGLGRHDLIDSASTQPLGCETCHLPHTSPNYGKSFMWAWKALPTSLSTYVATQPNNSLVTPTGINGNSRSMLCFSCHDATSVSTNGVTSANFLIPDGAAGPYPLVNSSLGSPALTTQHPVDATFPGSTFNDYVQPVLGAGPYGSVAGVGKDQLPLWSGGSTGTLGPAVECGTCHDVHNDYANNLTTTGAGGAPFLRIANINGTYLCRECHNAQ